jgi:uncharacterized protein (DUF433 family)
MIMPDTDLLTPAEAAIVTSMTVRQVNKLIDEELPARVRPVRGGRRFVTTSGAACLRARKQVSGLLTGAARRRMYKVIVEGKTEAMVLGDLLTVDVAAIKRETTRKVADLRRMRTLATSDPETLGGRPCFKGTRIPVAQIAELVAKGADAGELLEDYPALTREMIGAAPTLAKAYPARGRPRARPWAADGPVSETRSPRG